MFAPDRSGKLLEAYRNPVAAFSSPDPFVLKYHDGYWCYCTGRSDEGCFPIYRSQDLVHWTSAGFAMPPLDADHMEYWAPEVTCWNGRFYLYYGVGNGLDMHLRVATSDTPGGPFTDAGRRMTTEPFAIDPHVFLDDDGRRWMFYATDFLNHSHIGTGTVCDLMRDPLTLDGNPSPVTRARYDWQLFDPHRLEKGGVRWHTVEGPAVLKYKGRYYEMFSGGNWMNTSYGIGYAYAGSITDNGEWVQVCDGESLLPLLRSIPGRVMGPGHNCVVRGPDNRQLYCVYHQWNDARDARLMSVSRLEFIGPQLAILGGDGLEEPSPALPFVSHGPSIPLKLNGSSAGGWSIDDAGVIRQSDPAERSTATVDADIRSGVLVEMWIRADSSNSDGLYGVTLSHGTVPMLHIRFNPLRYRVELVHAQENGAPREAPMLNGSLRSYGHLRFQISGKVVRAQFDDGPELRTCVEQIPDSMALMTERTTADFAGLTISRSWEDRFDEAGFCLSDLGWQGDSAGWAIDTQDHAALRRTTAGAGELFKHTPSADYEFVANVRVERAANDSHYGFFPAASDTSKGPRVGLQRTGGEWFLVVWQRDQTRRLAALHLFDPFEFEQFRFRVRNGNLTIARRSEILAELQIDTDVARVGIYADGPVAFEVVRVSDLPAIGAIECQS